MTTRDEIMTEIRKAADRGRRLNALQNEGGEGFDHTDNAKIDALHAELDALIISEWDLETTVARRKSWNDAITSGCTSLDDLQSATGISKNELVEAIQRHGI